MTPVHLCRVDQGKASTKISLPNTLNDNSASRTDSVSVSQQK
jgi:hypothetical protein